MSMEELELPNFCKRFIYISCVWALVFHVYLSTMSRPGAAEVRRRSQILWNLFLLRTQVQLPALPWHPKTHSNFRNRKSHTFNPCDLLYKCGAYKLIQSHANKIVNLNLKNYQEKSFKAKVMAAQNASTFVQIALTSETRLLSVARLQQMFSFENVGLEMTGHNLIINEKYKYCSKSYLLMDVQVEIMLKIMFPKTCIYKGNIFCISRHFIYPGTRSIS